MINGKHGQGTHSVKMGADKSFEKSPKCPKTYLPKLSAQTQKFGIFYKERLYWASLVRAAKLRYI